MNISLYTSTCKREHHNHMKNMKNVNNPQAKAVGGVRRVFQVFHVLHVFHVFHASPMFACVVAELVRPKIEGSFGLSRVRVIRTALSDCCTFL